MLGRATAFEKFVLEAETSVIDGGTTVFEWNMLEYAEDSISARA